MLARRLDHEPAEEAGGRAVREREPREQAEQRRVAGARRKLSAIGVPVWRPHTGRLSTSTETSTSALSWVGSAIQLRTARSQDASERTKRGSDAVAPWASACSPHSSRRATVVVAIASRRDFTSSGASNHTIALSTSELGSASRRAWLPSASHANSAPTTGASVTVSSRIRRVRASTTTEYTAATLAGATCASCIAIR